MHRKPGVILLPVSAVFLIFIVLLVLLINQKQSNNALDLEYRASRIINLLLDLYTTEQEIDPTEIDANIIGYGFYDEDRNVLQREGTAPSMLPTINGRPDGIMMTDSRSIIIVRSGLNAPMMGQMMPGDGMRRYNGNRDNRDNHDSRQPLPPVLMKYRLGIYLEYSNSSFINERRLVILMTALFIVFFTISAIFVFRLYQANRRLLVKNEHDKQLIQLGEAARTLAHEIRNPLGALKIQRDLLSRKLPPGFEGNLQVIDGELKRLNTLVERVGEFLRNPLGRPEWIDLQDFIHRLYSARDDVSITDIDQAGVYFDAERLRTVFDNLVNNAVESGGSADVVIMKNSRMTVAEVRDRGPGFSDEAMKRLFDPFFTTKNNGTGLGLSIVKRLVESAGGSISLSNSADGASVRINFGDQDESSDS